MNFIQKLGKAYLEGLKERWDAICWALREVCKWLDTSFELVSEEMGCIIAYWNHQKDKYHGHKRLEEIRTQSRLNLSGVHECDLTEGEREYLNKCLERKREIELKHLRNLRLIAIHLFFWLFIGAFLSVILE